MVLEQAEGVLAQQGQLETDEALVVLRRQARDHNLRLSDLAAALVTRQLPGTLHGAAQGFSRRRL